MSSVPTAVAQPEHTRVRHSARVLGRSLDLEIDGDWSLIDRSLLLLKRFEATLSRLLPMSEVNRLNARPGQDVPVSDDLGHALAEALRMHLRTGGGYDPAILPSPGEIGVRLRGDGTARLDHGTRLDLSGIDAGLAADLLVDDLTRWGATGVSVCIGGTYRAVGSVHPSITIVDPASGERVATHVVVDGALVVVAAPVIGRGALPTTTSRSDRELRVRMAAVVHPSATDAAAVAEAAVLADPARSWAIMDDAGATGWLLTAMGVVEVGRA